MHNLCLSHWMRKSDLISPNMNDVHDQSYGRNATELTLRWFMELMLKVRGGRNRLAADFPSGHASSWNAGVALYRLIIRKKHSPQDSIPVLPTPDYWRVYFPACGGAQPILRHNSGKFRPVLCRRTWRRRCTQTNKFSRQPTSAANRYYNTRSWVSVPA